jgi:hypothetical protein
MAPNDSGDKDVILKYFDSSQQDFRQRVELKQAVLLAHAGATAALVAFIIQQNRDHPNAIYLLLVVPLFALLTASHFADHMLATTGIANYQIKELQPRLSALKVPEVLHESAHFRPLKSIFWMLQLGEFMLIGLPSAGALFAFLIALRVRWMTMSDPARWGSLLAALVDCAALVLSVTLLVKVAKNTAVFASKRPKGKGKPA